MFFQISVLGSFGYIPRSGIAGDFSSTEGHLSYFQVLAIMNKAAINIHVKIFMCL